MPGLVGMVWSAMPPTVAVARREETTPQSRRRADIGRSLGWSLALIRYQVKTTKKSLISGDVVSWCCVEGPAFLLRSPGDGVAVVGNDPTFGQGLGLGFKHRHRCP
jgi:hypothetical protein